MNVIPFLARRLSGAFARTAAPAAVLLLSGGCASTYRFTVDAVHHPSAATTGASYRLAFSGPAFDEPDAEHVASQLAKDVRTALSAKGLFEAPPGTRPSLEVEIDFGLDGPVQRMQSHTEPVYVTAPSAPRAPGRAGADDLGRSPVPRKIGDRTVTETITVYRKFLRLTARPWHELPTEESEAPLWSIVVNNEDESADLGHYVRLMTAAAMDLINEQTSADHLVVLTDGDGRVTFIERGV